MEPPGAAFILKIDCGFALPYPPPQTHFTFPCQRSALVRIVHRSKQCRLALATDANERQPPIVVPRQCRSVSPPKGITATVYYSDGNRWYSHSLFPSTETAEVEDEDDFVKTFYILIFTLLAFSFVSAGWMMYIVREKDTKCMYQQVGLQNVSPALK